MKSMLGLIFPMSFVLVGMIMVGLGIYIKSSKKIEIINGVSKLKNYDRNGLSNFAGKNMILMGTLLLIINIVGSIVFLQLNSMIVPLISLIPIMLILLYFSF